MILFKMILINLSFSVFLSVTNLSWIELFAVNAILYMISHVSSVQSSIGTGILTVAAWRGSQSCMFVPMSHSVFTMHGTCTRTDRMFWDDIGEQRMYSTSRACDISSDMCLTISLIDEIPTKDEMSQILQKYNTPICHRSTRPMSLAKAF